MRAAKSNSERRAISASAASAIALTFLSLIAFFSFVQHRVELIEGR
jgi:hypothetical protein